MNDLFENQKQQFDDLVAIAYYTRIAKGEIAGEKKFTKEELIFNIEKVLEKYHFELSVNK